MLRSWSLRQKLKILTFSQDPSLLAAGEKFSWSPGLTLILVASPSLKICYMIGSLTVTGESRYRKYLKQNWLGKILPPATSMSRGGTVHSELLRKLRGRKLLGHSSSR